MMGRGRKARGDCYGSDDEYDVDDDDYHSDTTDPLIMVCCRYKITV